MMKKELASPADSAPFTLASWGWTPWKPSALATAPDGSLKAKRLGKTYPAMLLRHVFYIRYAGRVFHFLIPGPFTRYRVLLRWSSDYDKAGRTIAQTDGLCPGTQFLNM